MTNLKVSKAAFASVAIVGAVSAFIVASPAQAQNGPRINSRALEKATFYNAPREIQIIDDRPVVRDFREAPAAEQSIALPPGPNGGGGGGGGGGAGALENGGGPSSIPGGGLHIPGVGTDPGYRGPRGQGLPLPKSGFGRDTNIPARGMGVGPLPDGTNTNRLMGKMLNPSVAKGVATGPARGMQPTTGRSNGNYGGPPAATYSGGYGSGSGSGYGGSASKTEANVRGSLLRH